jgi:ribonucleotide reductase alpha subunit
MQRVSAGIHDARKLTTVKPTYSIGIMSEKTSGIEPLYTYGQDEIDNLAKHMMKVLEENPDLIKRVGKTLSGVCGSCSNPKSDAEDYLCRKCRDASV